MKFNQVGLFLMCFFAQLQMAAQPIPTFVSKPAVQSIVHPEKVATTTQNSVDEIFRSHFKVPSKYTWEFISTETDKFNFTHSRYQQFYEGIKIENGVVILHTDNSGEMKISGSVLKPSIKKPEYFISKNEVATTLKNSSKEKSSEIIISKSELLWVWDDYSNEFKLQYKVEFSTEGNLENEIAYIDAMNGNQLRTIHHSCHADVTGLAHTAYHNTRPITTNNTNGTYFLRSYSRGLGIETMNLNHQLNYNSKTEFTDADNIWEQTTVTNENYATDAHYAAEQFYDFLNAKFNRNSIDNNGQKLISYLNYGNNLRNAFWNGSAVVYGSGNSQHGPLTTIDITSHEFTHGLIQKTANLNYAGEPGTINEAIADIFGTAVEHRSLPQQADWLIGEKSGLPLRSMSQPELYNQPSTYFGTNWYHGTGDNGGVHINSGFINKWFYLLSQGGSGVNDAGTPYSVQGITIEKSVEIVYHVLISYLLPTTNFNDFMKYTVLGAADLYGNCSPEYIAVLNAWKAVGLYDYTSATVHIQNFSNSRICDGDSIQLHASGLPGTVFSWYRNNVLIATGNVSSIYISQPGNYSVSESRCGLIFNSPVSEITLNLLPVVSTSNYQLCEGETIPLQGFPSGGIYSVSNPYSGSSTPYSYTFTDSVGCSNAALGLISVNEKPEVHILNETTSIPENMGAIMLTGNVNGVFSGFGVTGNYFHPEQLTNGGPYLVYLRYTNNSGCTSSDSIYFYVTKPCVRDFDETEIIVSKIPNTGANAFRLKLNVSTSDFTINWNLPPNIILLKNYGDTILDVMNTENESIIQASLLNTCHETTTISKLITSGETDEFKITVGPNPAKDEVHIHFHEKKTDRVAQIEISDSKGKLVRKFTTNKSNLTLNISGINGGVYYLHIQSADYKSVQKLVIN